MPRRLKFLAIVKENIRRRGGPASIVMSSGRGAPDSGQNLEQIAKARGVSPEQAAVDIVIAGGASIVSFNMSEDDIATIMRQPWTMGSSDGGLDGAGRDAVASAQQRRDGAAHQPLRPRARRPSRSSTRCGR